MTPSGILHIAAFMILYEAYMGIDPHFDLWGHGYPCQVWVGRRSLFQHPQVQIDERVVEAMVLPEERR
jgi:hypothetical protein